MPGGRKPLNKKKAIRDMRKGVPGMIESDGRVATHKMEFVGDISKRRGNFGVYPSIAPKKGKEKSTNPSDWKTQTAAEADKRGELINVKSRRRAEKLSAGSWKKGVERKEAMKEYRSRKKTDRKKT